MKFTKVVITILSLLPNQTRHRSKHRSHIVRVILQLFLRLLELLLRLLKLLQAVLHAAELRLRPAQRTRRF